MKKILSLFTSVAIVAMSFVGVAVPATANAANPNAPVYSITTNAPVLSPFTISLTGTASSTNYTGSLGTQHVSVVSWGDGAESLNLASFAFTSTSTKSFVGTWSASHTYATTGPKTIIVSVCHGTCTGNDGSEESSITVNVIILAATLTVIKQVTNDNGGTAVPSDFTMTVGGTNVSSSSFSGSSVGTTVTLDPGAYSVNELFHTGYAMTASSTDCAGTIASGQAKTCTITNNDVAINSAPTLAAIGDKSVDELQTLAFNTPATDPDADTLTWSLSGTLPAGASINSSTGAFSWTPSESQGPGSYPITINVSDGSVTDSEAITITVAEVNALPVLGSIGDKSIAENSPLSFTILASDSDLPLNTLTYSASNLPVGANFNAATRTFTWTPTYTDAGTYSAVHFEVSDGIATSSEDITLTVTNTNRPPILDLIGNQSVAENILLSFGVSGSDPDGDSLIFAATNLPAGATFDDINKLFSWTPSFSQSGNYSVTFSVFDGDLYDTEVVPINVGNVNQTPSLSSIGDQSVNELQTLSFTASASDADSDTLIWSLTGAPVGASIDSSTGAFTWTPTEAQGPGVYNVTFNVADATTTDSEIVAITVLEVNLAPVAVNDTANTSEDTPVTITAATLLANDTDTDLPANTLSVAAVGNALNGGVILSGTDVIFTPDADWNGSASFDYSVSDGALTATGTVAVTVSAVNDVPTITLLGANPFSLVANTVFTDPGATATDTEDGNLTSAIEVSGSVSTSTPGTYTLVYSVTDSASSTASTTRTVIVTAAPVENTSTLCSDGIDNDGDGFIDLNDPDCAAFIPVVPAPVPSGGGGGNGPIVGTFGFSLPATSGGRVLGASTSTDGAILVDDANCVPYLTSYIKFGRKNDVAQVKKLQLFLNKHLSINLPVTGFYGNLTMNAVKRFQSESWQEVLLPWVAYGLSDAHSATGYVYKTTRRHINNLNCPTLNLPLPDLSKTEN